MAQPSTNGVDVNSCAKKMSSCGMSNGMGTDSFSFQRWGMSKGFFDGAFHQGMNSEASDGLATAIKEEMFCGRPSLDQSGDFVDGLWPERTATQLISFASYQNRREIPFGDVGEIKISDE